MDPYRALEVRVLPKLPRSEDAKKLLDRVCWQVQPIMRKRMWSVPVVTEFLPRSPNLLGLNKNGGQEICIRLRESKDSELFPFEHALGTMLHELTHIVHGPHNAKFYALLDELENECDKLMDSKVGGSGAGFDLPGVKLSGEAHNPTALESRLKAIAAAEKRQQMQELLGAAGGRRLGGAPPIKGRKPSEMAAEAALRRQRDEQWCHSHLGNSHKEGVATADDARHHIEDVSNAASSGKRAMPDMSFMEADATRLRPQRRKMRATRRAAPEDASQVLCQWQCRACTLINTGDSDSCVACGGTPAQVFNGVCSCNRCSSGQRRPTVPSLVPCLACSFLNATAQHSSQCALCGGALADLSTPQESEVVLLD